MKDKTPELRLVYGGAAEEPAPLKKKRKKPEHLKSVFEVSTVIAQLQKAFVDTQKKQNFTHLLVLDLNQTEQIRFFECSSLEIAKKLLEVAFRPEHAKLLTVLDMDTPFERQVHSDAHQSVHSWDALREYMAEDTAQFLDQIGYNSPSQRPSRLMAQVEEELAQTFERGHEVLLVYGAPEGHLNYQSSKYTPRANEIHQYHLRAHPNDQLVMALNTGEPLKDQIDPEIYEGLLSVHPLIAAPIINTDVPISLEQIAPLLGSPSPTN